MGSSCGWRYERRCKNLLSDRAEKELVNLSILDWKARKDMSKWLGKTIYTLGEYDKVKRFSFYLGDDHLLLVSTEKMMTLML